MPAAGAALRIGVLGWQPDDLHAQRVTYQHAQFLAMRDHADVVLGDEAYARLDDFDAVVVFDERGLLVDVAPRLPARISPLLVYVTHDYWHHPLHVAQYLEGHERVLSVVRHHAAQRLHRMLMPAIPCVVQRPGVDTSLFRPAAGPKEFDIVLSGSENPEYPVRQRLNAIVREQRARRGWNVLDLADPASGADAQREYAPSLAASKVSPTGTPRGALTGSRLIMQYVDASPQRARLQDVDEFYGYGLPEVVVRDFDLGGVPSPRYLESMAAKTLLVADLPDDEPWFRDKMVAISLDDSDEQIGDVIDRWVRDDDARERLCEHAYAETMRTETSAARAAELVEIVREHL
jgi:Glycosyl transferases group 1